MIMLHGLGVDTSLVFSTAPAPSDFAIYSSPAVFAPAPSGCPTGYVMSEFGCTMPTVPGAVCPAGSIQTGSGCLPAVPAPVPQPKPPAPIFTPPAPLPPTVSQAQAFIDRLITCMQPGYGTSAACTRLFSEIELQRTQCQVDPLHHDCVELTTALTKAGYIGAPKNAPGTQVAPVGPSPEETPPVTPQPKKISKGLIALGVLGAGAAIAAAILGNRQ